MHRSVFFMAIIIFFTQVDKFSRAHQAPALTFFSVHPESLCATPTCPIRSSVLHSSATGNAFTARPAPHTAIRRSGALWAREAVAHLTMRAHSTKWQRIQHTASIGAGEPAPAEARQEIAVGILKIFWRNCLSSDAIIKIVKTGPTHPLCSQRQQASRVPRATMQKMWDTLFFHPRLDGCARVC